MEGITRENLKTDVQRQKIQNEKLRRVTVICKIISISLTHM